MLSICTFSSLNKDRSPGLVYEMLWTNSVLDYEEFFTKGNSPNQKCGYSLEQELQYRYFGAHLVQRAGRLLKMPQAGIMTGQILLQQFYCQRSFYEYPLLDVAMACTLIAGKVEESYRRVRDVVNIFHWLYQLLRGVKQKRSMDYMAVEYYEWRDRVTNTEVIILRELGFHVQPRHPIGLLSNYLNALEIIDPRLSQKAINYANDGMRSVACLCHQPATIACVAIAMAADDFEIQLPSNPNWFEVFDANENDLLTCKTLLQSVYDTKFDLNIPLTKMEIQGLLNIPTTLNLKEESATTTTTIPIETTQSSSAATLNPLPDKESRSRHDRSRSRSHSSYRHSRSRSRSRSRSNSKRSLDRHDDRRYSSYDHRHRSDRSQSRDGRYSSYDRHRQSHRSRSKSRERHNDIDHSPQNRDHQRHYRSYQRR